MTAYEESDEYCPHCDNHYVGINSASLQMLLNAFSSFQVIEAKTRQVVGVEAEDVRKDARYGLNGTLH
jgi:hypothetical protein